MAQPKGSGVVLAAEKPESNQCGPAAANQNSFPEMCSSRMKFLSYFDKLDNLTHCILHEKNILAYKHSFMNNFTLVTKF